MNSFDTLESRRMLTTAGATLVGTTLLVRGAERAENAIDVTYNADGIHIDVSIVADREGTPQTTAAQFDKSAVTIVKVRGGRRDDVITLGSESSPFLLNARVNGMSGADSITTGSGNDRIAAGAGDDTVNAGDGDDLVFGERGNDVLNGDAGNDFLWGGIGEDTLHGGAGDDVLGALLGTNLVTGGDGADKFVIKPGKQSQASDFVDGVDTYRILGKGSTDGSTPPPTA